MARAAREGERNESEVDRVSESDDELASVLVEVDIASRVGAVPGWNRDGV